MKKLIKKLKAYLKLFLNRCRNIHPLEQSFINTAPKLYTTRPEETMEFNQIINHIKQTTDEQRKN